MADSPFDQPFQEGAGPGPGPVTVTDLPGAAGSPDDVYAADLPPVHCREPMSLVAPETKIAATLQTHPSHQATSVVPEAVPAHVLRCRCGFQMDAPAGTDPTN
jgi:hypothetical protein